MSGPIARSMSAGSIRLFRGATTASGTHSIDYSGGFTTTNTTTIIASAAGAVSVDQSVMLDGKSVSFTFLLRKRPTAIVAELQLLPCRVV